MFLRDLPPGVKTGLILTYGAFLLWAGYVLAGVIAPFLLSIVVAYILNPLVRKLEKRRIPRPWAVLTLYIIGIFLGFIVVVPASVAIFTEAQDLSRRLSDVDVTHLAQEYQGKVRVLLDRYSENPVVRDYLAVSLTHEKLQEIAAHAAGLSKNAALSLLKSILGFLLSAFSSVMTIFLIPILTFYVLIDMDLLFDKAIVLVPPIYRDSFQRIWHEIDQLLSSLLRGQLMAATIFACLMSIGLWMSGLNFAILLGPLAGVANMVPYLGGLVTVVLSTVSALTQYGFTQDFVMLMIKVGVTLAIVQSLDGLVLGPMVIGETVGLHPLAVMFALVVGGSVFGFPGMLLAVPATCVLKVLARELYHELYDQA